MKKFTFIFLFLILGNRLWCQSNFIIAGQRDSMIFTQLIPPYNLILSENQNDITFVASVSLDLDHNGDYTQLTSTEDFGGALGYDGRIYALGILMYDTMESLRSEQTDSVDTALCGYALAGVARRFVAGDTMWSNPIAWKWDVDLVNYTSEGGFGAACAFYDNTVPLDSPAYCMIMVITNTDTLLGYIHCKIIPAYNRGISAIYIYDYAVQGATATDTLASINQIAGFNSIQIYPTLFSNIIYIQSPTGTNYSLYNMQGEMIATGYGNSIHTETLADGVYLLELRNSESLLCKKVVKAK